jgi:hypothetical protein
MFASAAYPGLGQLLNDAEPKAAIVSAVEAFLIARLVVEDRRTRNSLRLYKQTNDERYYDEYSEHFDRRQALIWWAAVTAIYGLADAYVDAHLTSFDDTHAPRLMSSIGGETGDDVGASGRPGGVQGWRRRRVPLRRRPSGRTPSAISSRRSSPRSCSPSS